MTKRICIIGVAIFVAGLLTAFWLYHQNPPSAPVSTGGSGESSIGSSLKQSPSPAMGSDYRGVFAGIYSREWLPLESKAADDDLFSDARYSDHYLAGLMSAGDLEWGEFLVRTGLSAQGKKSFVELVAKKKLALRQATIASRAFGADAGKNARADFLRSVGDEYDAQIKATIGETNFSAYCLYEEEGVASVLAPFFVEVSALGFPLSFKQEKKLREKIASLSKVNARGDRELANAFLSYDAAVDESVELSLDQVLILREYQEAVRSSRKSAVRTAATLVSVTMGNPNAINLWIIRNFSKKAAGELSLDAATHEELRLALSDLLSERVEPDEFRRTITSLIGTDGFTKLIAFAGKSAVERNLNIIDRKLHVAGLGLTEAQREKLLGILEANANSPANLVSPADGVLDFLGDDARGLVERHQRARLMALTSVRGHRGIMGVH